MTTAKHATIDEARVERRPRNLRRVTLVEPAEGLSSRMANFRKSEDGINGELTRLRAMGEPRSDHEMHEISKMVFAKWIFTKTIQIYDGLKAKAGLERETFEELQRRVEEIIVRCHIPTYSFRQIIDEYRRIDLTVNRLLEVLDLPPVRLHREQRCYFDYVRGISDVGLS